MGEVDGLGDTVIGILLKGRLHPDMPFGCDLVGGDENPLDVVGDPRKASR